MYSANLLSVAVCDNVEEVEGGCIFSFETFYKKINASNKN